MATKPKRLCPKVAPRSLLGHPVHWLSFGGGSGLSPYAPGTMGTLITVPVVYLLFQLGISTYIAVTVLVCLLGIWVSARTAVALGVHDHGSIVIDEVAGFMLTMTALEPTWLTLTLGFLIFRLLDIWKPWPIRVLDRNLHGGAGIMLDDVLAGVLGCVAIHGLLWALDLPSHSLLLSS